MYKCSECKKIHETSYDEFECDCGGGLIEVESANDPFFNFYDEYDSDGF